MFSEIEKVQKLFVCLSPLELLVLQVVLRLSTTAQRLVAQRWSSIVGSGPQHVYKDQFAQ